jgi:hypothetical protein
MPEGPLPVCITHGCIEVRRPPDMEERKARCMCGKTEPSTRWGEIAFFVFNGEGSVWAATCGNCKYNECTHHQDYMDTLVGDRKVTCFDYVPRGPREHDSYYCGCRGWD